MKNLGVLSTTLSPWSHWSLSLSKGVAIGSIVVMFLLAACSDDPKAAGGTEEDAGIIAIEDKTVSGVSQKGPFVNGSSVTVYGLDGETLAQTGNIYEGKIRSDMGDFSVKVVKLASQYALLKANGFYRNEVTGEKSNSQMTLYALTDLSDRDEVNVNLLTHLAYERSLYLATNSMSVANAKKQAEAEVFKSFEIEGDFASAEDLNIFGENDQSAALLAISVLMQGDLKEADFSERLDNYARDIEVDGVWDDKKTATAIADWASGISLGGGLASVRSNVERWGQLFGVPPFEKYVNNFWWQNYGLGTCDNNHQGEVKANSNKLSAKKDVYFTCDNNAWRVATDIEKDTYKWIDPTVKNTAKDGDVRYGDVVRTNCYVYENKAWRDGDADDCSLELRGCTALRQDTMGLGNDKIWYVCDDGKWRNATTLEKDTYDHENNKDWADGTDGEIKKGSVTDSIYVFDATAWRAADNIEKVLGGCVPNIFDSVGKVDNKYYICRKRKWEKAPVFESDTYGQQCTSKENGLVIDGNVFELNKYYCSTNGWVSLLEGSVWDFPKEARLNPDIKYKKIKDERDQKEYRIVQIGDQVWMAENLNYADPLGQSWCYDNDEKKCEIGGRLYTLSVAQSVCPDGWHLPTDEEWNVLFSKVRGNGTSKMLKSTSGWTMTIPSVDVSCCGASAVGSSYKYNVSEYGCGNGLDAVGFCALPVGVFENGSFMNESKWTFFWSASGRYVYLVYDYNEGLSSYADERNSGFSVRCVKD